MLPASHLPEGSVNASVARAEPEAISLRTSFFWASVPASIKTGTASPMVEKNGPGSSARPASSITTTRSRKVPTPPYSSGMPRAVQPRSAIFFQRASSYPSPLSINLRTTLVLHSLARNSRAERRSISCSSEKAKSTARVESRAASRLWADSTREAAAPGAPLPRAEAARARALRKQAQRRWRAPA